MTVTFKQEMKYTSISQSSKHHPPSPPSQSPSSELAPSPQNSAEKSPLSFQSKRQRELTANPLYAHLDVEQGEHVVTHIHHLTDLLVCVVSVG
jgi:hypothetical protein